MMPFLRQWSPTASNAQDRDRQLDEQARQVAGTLADVVVPHTTALVEDRANGRYQLLAGVHGGFRLARTGTTVVGPATVVRQVVVAGPGPYVLDGITFQSFDPEGRIDSNTRRAALVDVTDTTANVTFANCRFVKRTDDTTQYVTIAAGATVHFLGCRFEPAGMAAGFVIDNAGVAADVGMTNSSNVTGQPHNNVTVIYETT